MTLCHTQVTVTVSVSRNKLQHKKKKTNKKVSGYVESPNNSHIYCTCDSIR